MQGDLVARMRDGICVKAWLHHDNLSPDLPATVELLSEAADRIEALEARLAEVMEGLRPFNAIAQAVFYIDEDGREMNASRADDLAVWGFDRVELTYGHLRAARRLVEEEDGR